MFLFLAFIFAFAGSSNAQASHRDEDIQRAIGLMVTHRYAESVALSDSLILSNPDNPDAHLQKAATLYTWMDDTGEYGPFEQSLLLELGITIDLSQKRLDLNARDVWALFYMGSAKLYRALNSIESNGISFGAVRDALSGTSLLEESMVSPDFMEPLVGLGSYLHSKARTLSWLPFQSGDRRRGIAMLRKAVSAGVQADAGARQRLAHALWHDGEFKESMSVALEASRIYPGSRFFIEVIARMLLATGRTQEAIVAYERIVDGLIETDLSTDAVRMKYIRYIAMAREMQGDFAEACSLTTELKKWKYEGVNQRWLKRKLAPVERISRRTCGE